MRQYLTLKDNWCFTKQEQNTVPTAVPGDWEIVSLPHTWNALDGQDGGSDYYRGKCWYVKELSIPRNSRRHLHLSGVSGSSILLRGVCKW